MTLSRNKVIKNDCIVTTSKLVDCCNKKRARKGEVYGSEDATLAR